MASPDNPPLPQYSLTIDGVDLTRYLEDAQWTITQNWSRQGDTAMFYLADEHADSPVVLSYVVKPLATIVFKDLGLNQILFSGVVTMPMLRYAGPNLARWQLQCADWTYLADRAVVFGDFSTQSADQIVKTLVAQSNCGITTNNVQPGPSIPRIQINYLTLSQAWKKISQYSSLLQTYGWYVDENHDLHFYNQAQAGSQVAFFSNVASDFQPSTYVQNFTGNYRPDFYYSWDATSIRNSALVRGGASSNLQTDLWLGNGNQVSWPLTYTPDSSNFNGTLTVGGVAKTVSIQTGTSATTQWVVVQAKDGGWFLTANTDSAPATGALVSFTYSYLAPVQTQVQDSGSITKFHSLPNGGVFGIYIADTTLNNVSSAQYRGRREVHTYALPEERVVFNTAENYTGHVRAGNVIRFKSDQVPDANNNYNSFVDDSFLVVQNRISGTLVGYRTYQITAARIGSTVGV